MRMQFLSSGMTVKNMAPVPNGPVVSANIFSPADFAASLVCPIDLHMASTSQFQKFPSDTTCNWQATLNSIDSIL